MAFDPNKPDIMSDERAKKLARWKRNRDYCAGADVVVDGNYLPKLAKEMANEDYEVHKKNTEMFPAAARTRQSHEGLIFRKKPVVKMPDGILSRSATSDGMSWEQVAKWVFKEYGTANDGGALIDYAAVNKRMTVAEQEKAGLRSYIARYPAESILSTTYEDVNGVRKLVEVVLKESDDRVRLLEIVGGFYQVSVFTRDAKNKNEWHKSGPVMPRISNAAFSDIPFVLFADDEEGAHYDDLCRSNDTHYAKKGRLEGALMWASKPQPWIAGVKDGGEYSVALGSLWTFENERATCGYLTFNGDSIPAMERQIDLIEQHMVVLGSRMLASDATANAASESEISVARRSASENSILAGIARHVSDLMVRIIEWTARFEALPLDGIRYELNTDFVPAPIGPQLLAQLTAMNQAGQLPDKLYFESLQQGEIVGEAITFEEYAAMRAEAKAEAAAERQATIAAAQALNPAQEPAAE